MEETPVSVLCQKINFYRSFINRLKTKEGIDKDAPQEKLDKLICEYEEKIKEFEAAIKILDPNAKCEIPLKTESDKFDGKAMEKSFIMIGLANQIISAINHESNF